MKAADDQGRFVSANFHVSETYLRGPGHSTVLHRWCAFFSPCDGCGLSFDDGKQQEERKGCEGGHR